MPKTTPQQGRIEEELNESGKVLEVSPETSDREGLAHGIAAVIMAVMGDSPDGEGTITANYSVRKAKGGKPRRVIVHANHQKFKQHSVLVSFGKFPTLTQPP
jgi:hypothetical protein